MIAILTSGVALGVHVPGVLLQRRLRDKNVVSQVFVLENYWRPEDRGKLERSRLAFQRDFRIALATQRLGVHHDKFVTKEVRAALFSEWRAAGVEKFVIFSGFWVPIVVEYEEVVPGTDVVVCNMDSVASTSFRPHVELCLRFEHLDFLSAAKGSVPYTISIARDDPVPWRCRADRLFAHGGGWGMGTYRDAVAELSGHGWDIDYVAEEVVEGLSAGARRYTMEPRWRAWLDDGFPPIGRAGVPPHEWLRRDDYHPSFDLIRSARALVTKPGGGSLLDALAAATPVVLLAPFGRAEEANARLWEALGLGIDMGHWRQSGYSAEMLREVHERSTTYRTGIPDLVEALLGD